MNLRKTRKTTQNTASSEMEQTSVFAQTVRPQLRVCGLLTGLGCLFLLTGCCSFERDWRACSCYVGPANEMAGCWKGRWHSDKNGHNGTLRAIITKRGENQYHARFKATFSWVLPYKFDIPLTVREEGGVHIFDSQVNLGTLAGGEFSYSGCTDTHDFAASYCASGGDHGTFTMQRILTCEGGCEDTACCDTTSGCDTSSSCDDSSGNDSSGNDSSGSDSMATEDGGITPVRQ